MAKIINFNKHNSRKSEEYHSYYLEKLGIQTLSQYKSGENRDEIESLLETILNQIQEKPNQNNLDLEQILDSEQKTTEKYITKHKYKKEKITQFPQIQQYFKFLNSQATSHRVNPKSKAHVFYVPSSSLPSGVLGMYIPDLHIYYVANDLSKDQIDWVDFHEEYHSLFGAGEAQADDYATRKLGYNPFSPRQHSSAA